MEKLIGQGNQGQFVIDGQETNEDFKNVSQKWYEKTISIEEALENLAEGRQSQEDITVDAAKVAPYFDDESGEVGLEDWSSEKRYKLTPHAWRLYGTRIDVPHTTINYYLQSKSLKPNGKPKFIKDKEDAKTFYNIMMNNRRHLDSGKLFLRTYNGDTCRAVLTDKYTPIDNGWFLEVLNDLIPGGRVSHHDYCTPDTLQFNLLMPDSIRQEDDSDYGGMISVTNCEIGTRINSGTPSLFRAICMNGCIWDQQKGTSWRQIHKGKFKKDDLIASMTECIQKQIPLVDDVIKRFLELRSWELGKVKMQQVLTQIALDCSLSGEQVAELFACYATEKHKSAFGVTNAMTRFGQTQDADTWHKMDTLAGKFITEGKTQWDRLLAKANYMTDDDLEKALKKTKNKNDVFSLVAV